MIAGTGKGLGKLLKGSLERRYGKCQALGIQQLLFTGTGPLLARVQMVVGNRANETYGTDDTHVFLDAGSSRSLAIFRV